MDHAGDAKVADHLANNCAVANVALHDIDRAADDLPKPLDHAALTVAEVVEQNGSVTRACHLDRNVAADEASATGEEDGVSHGRRAYASLLADTARGKAMVARLRCLPSQSDP